MKLLLKTPISYYGGKQNLLKEILPLIPAHDSYVEPFFGGGAVFFAKRPVKHEVINDIDNNVITFYRVLKGNFEALHREIDCTLHSEAVYRFTKEIYQNPEEYGDVQVAYSFWVQTNMSFGNKPTAGFRFEMQNPLSVSKTFNYAKLINKALRKRVNKTYIFNRSALDIITRFDAPGVFQYFDPPYPESDCGHYEQHKDVYYELLDLLPGLECNWLMSSYPSEQLTELRVAHGWNTKDIVQTLAVDGRRKERKTKTECLTWNYEKGNEQLSIF